MIWFGLTCPACQHRGHTCRIFFSLQLWLIPNPVGGGRRDVDGQRPRQLLHLDGEQQWRVGHLLNLLFDVLIFRGLLEVLRLSDFVNKSQNPPACPATGSSTANKREGVEGWGMNQSSSRLIRRPQVTDLRHKSNFVAAQNYTTPTNENIKRQSLCNTQGHSISIATDSSNYICIIQ